MTAAIVPGGPLRRPEDGEAQWFLGARVTYKASGGETEGRLAVAHVHAPRGHGSPTHVHQREDEAWYVLEGQLRFWLDGAEITATGGDFVLGPRGREHKFAVDSSEAYFLMLFTPAGFEDFTRTVGTAAVGPGLPPPGPAEPADLDALAAAARTAGIDITGP